MRIIIVLDNQAYMPGKMIDRKWIQCVVVWERKCRRTWECQIKCEICHAKKKRRRRRRSWHWVVGPLYPLVSTSQRILMKSYLVLLLIQFDKRPGVVCSRVNPPVEPLNLTGSPTSSASHVSPLLRLCLAELILLTDFLHMPTCGDGTGNSKFPIRQPHFWNVA